MADASVGDVALLRDILAMTNEAVALLPPQGREGVSMLRRAALAPIEAIVAMEDAMERDTLLVLREMVAEVGLAAAAAAPRSRALAPRATRTRRRARGRR